MNSFFRGEDVYNHVDVGMCKTSRYYVTKSIAENQVEQSLDAYFSALAEKNLIQEVLSSRRMENLCFKVPMAFSMQKEHTKPTPKLPIELLLLVKHTQQR